MFYFLKQLFLNAVPGSLAMHFFLTLFFSNSFPKPFINITIYIGNLKDVNILKGILWGFSSGETFKQSLFFIEGTKQNPSGVNIFKDFIKLFVPLIYV